MIATLIALTLQNSGCKSSDDITLLGHWNMTAIRYENGSEQVLGGSNAVVIESDHVTELYDGQGKRRYPYQRNGAELMLDTGGDQVIWTVVSQNDNSLELDTPIGTYLLAR